jgi:hypothetical protein
MPPGESVTPKRNPSTLHQIVNAVLITTSCAIGSLVDVHTDSQNLIAEAKVGDEASRIS